MGLCDSLCFSSKKPSQYTRRARSKHEVKKQNRRLEFEAVGKPAPLVETKWPSGPGNVISAGVAFENGDQATIRGEVRREQVYQDKGKQPDPQGWLAVALRILFAVGLQYLAF